MALDGVWLSDLPEYLFMARGWQLKDGALRRLVETRLTKGEVLTTLVSLPVDQILAAPEENKRLIKALEDIVSQVDNYLALLDMVDPVAPASAVEALRPGYVLPGAAQGLATARSLVEKLDSLLGL